MNPNFCKLCYLQSPLEGAEQEITALFVDVRGFTQLSQTVSPTQLTDLMNEFYRVAAAAVIAQDGHVDKFVGDQIMAYFGPPYVADAHALRAVQAAIDIVSGVAALDAGFETGTGVATGIARIGPIGGSGVQDYTVLGNVVNLASRLQGEAAAEEILLTEPTYEQIAVQFPGLAVRSFELKGIEGITRCRVLDTVAAREGSDSQ
jgi:adenylate cyclase